MTNSRTPNPKAPTTPAERLQWWENFGKIVYETGALVPIVEPLLVKAFPANKQQKFADSMHTLYKVIESLYNDHVKKVIDDLKAGKTPPVPDTDLPPLPDWPDAPDKTSEFSQIWHALLPPLQTMVDHFGKDSDMGLAILEVIDAVNGVITQLQSEEVKEFETF